MTPGRPQRIVILGGGFGGLYTALELEKRLAHDSNLEVTLVNRENFFLFTPMLHEVAASDLDITHIVNPIRKMLRRVRFFDGDVESIDLARKRVVVTHGLRNLGVLQVLHNHHFGRVAQLGCNRLGQPLNVRYRHTARWRMCLPSLISSAGLFSIQAESWVVRAPVARKLFFA